MHWRNKTAFLVTCLIFLVAAFAIWRYSDHRASQRQSNHERCAQQANDQVAEPLRTNGAFASKGQLLRVSGSDYRTPGPWNLQGSFYLALHRVAQFTDGTQQLEVIVQKGATRHTFQPRPESAVIYVSNPNLQEE